MRGESGILVFLLMMGINFPAGWVMAYFFYPLDSSGAVFPEAARFVLEWTGIFLAGYIQWFYAVPFLARSVKRILRRTPKH